MLAPPTLNDLFNNSENLIISSLFAKLSPANNPNFATFDAVVVYVLLLLSAEFNILFCSCLLVCLPSLSY